MIVLRNAHIVNGDGRTAPFVGSIVIEDGHIASAAVGDLSGGPDDLVLDLGGRLAVPGAIDAHAHAAAPGPRFASGTPGVSLFESLGNLRRHLTQGHTTIVDLDGFKLPGDNAQIRGVQPVKVEMSTVHFEPMFLAADACDGAGLLPEHRAMTASQMRDEGAVVIGEVGAGMTLGGGGQDYLYIPAAVEKATGAIIDRDQANALKRAVLTRHIRPGNTDRERTAELIVEYGLGNITVDDLVTVIEESVMPSMQDARDGLIRSATLAQELQLPTLVHNSAPSDEASRAAVEIAGDLFIGGHSNHGTFNIDDCVANARWVREHGGHIEVDTFDVATRIQLKQPQKNLIALLRENLVDIIATDYAAGYWDSIWEMVEGIVQLGHAPIEKAVAMATGNVGKALPRIGADRGVLKAGMAADIVVTSPRSLADIELVIIDGQVVYTGTTVPPVTTR